MLGRWPYVVRELFHPAHPRVVDPRIKGQRRVFLYQAFLATGVLLLVLWLEDLLSNTAIFAAIASTAFVLFVTPRSVTASPRHVIGGHLVCVVAGVAVSLLLHSAVGQDLVAEASFLFDTGAAVSVGLGIVLMGLTETEHAPAAGTALGLAIIDIDWALIGVIMGSVIVMSACQQLLLPRLRNFL